VRAPSQPRVEGNALLEGGSGKPIRVVLVLEATEGGTQRYLRELVACLTGEGCDVRVVCSLGRDPRSEKDLATFERQGARVRVLEMTRSPRPVLDLVASLRLRRLLTREPFDVLHLHSAKAGWIGRLAALGLPGKVVYTPHAFPFTQRRSWVLRSAFLIAERVTAPRTDLLLAVSESEARLAIQKGLFQPERVRVVPNAVDVEHCATVVRAIDRDRRESPTVFGFLGMPRPQKGPELFLRAARDLIRAGEEVAFLLPRSRPWDERVLRRVREDELGPWVELVPCPEGLDPLHERVHFGVLPSLWEGLPFALLDALALGIPVVGSDIPALREVLGRIDTELLFPAGNGSALAERLRYWMHQPHSRVRDLGHRGRELVRSEYDLRTWRRRIRDVYRDLAGGPGRGSDTVRA
jgi:glycosyltransferase involved in cell wall biosynthesis